MVKLSVLCCILVLFFAFDFCKAQCAGKSNCTECNLDTNCVWCVVSATNLSCTAIDACNVNNTAYECGADPDCPTAYGVCQIYLGITTPMIDAFNGEQTVISQICPHYVEDWFKPGDYVWASPDTDIYDWGPYTGNADDVYELPYDEIDIMDLQDLFEDPEVGGNQACLVSLSEFYCALAWARCNLGKNCFDYIDKDWCISKQKPCNFDNQAIIDNYGEDYLELLDALNCSNEAYFRSANQSSSKRQTRQLRRDYTPPVTDGTPIDQCDLPKTTKTSNKSAPPAIKPHPCPGEKASKASKIALESVMAKTFAATILFLSLSWGW